MTGRVVCFRPRSGRGIVRTECGDELPFEANGDSQSIHGDDLVEFVFQENGTSRKATVVRVVQKARVQASNYENLLRELFGTVAIERTPTR